MDKLKDIKPILDVHEYSFYYFILAIILGIIVLFILLKLFKKWRANREKSYDFNLKDSKQTAYLLIKLIRDKEGSKEYIDKLHNEYAYKKDVPDFDARLLEEITNKFKIKVGNVTYK